MRHMDANFESTVNNDFHETQTIFKLFDGLEVKDIASTPVVAPEVTSPPVNGVHSQPIEPLPVN